MDNVLIDDRRIHVDFSQSVSKIKWKGKGILTDVPVCFYLFGILCIHEDDLPKCECGLSSDLPLVSVS